MVGASDFVLIKLICDAPKNPVFEVDYVVPRDVYEAELSLFTGVVTVDSRTVTVRK